MVQGGARQHRVVQGSAGWCRVVQGGAGWCRVVQGGAELYEILQNVNGGPDCCKSFWYDAVNVMCYIMVQVADGSGLGTRSVQ